MARYRIQLAKGIAAGDAAVVARIAFDSTAREEAARAGRSLVGDQIEKARRPFIDDHCFPKIGFPFVGRTTLNCRGKWVKADGQFAFLVLSLISCTGSFPFKDLEFSVDGETRQTSAKPDNSNDTNAMGGKELSDDHKRPKASEAKLCADAHGAAPNGAITVSPVDTRFLTPITCRRRPTSTSSGISTPSTQASEVASTATVLELSADEPGHAPSAYKGLEFSAGLTMGSAAEGSFDLHDIIPNFMAVLPALVHKAEKRNKLAFNFVSLNDSQGGIFAFAPDSVESEWRNVVPRIQRSILGLSRRRRTLVVHLEFPNIKQDYYLVEIERLCHEPGIHTHAFYTVERTPIGSQIFSDMLHQLFEENGRWVTTRMPDVLHRNFEHTDYSAGNPKASQRSCAQQTAAKLLKWLEWAIPRKGVRPLRQTMPDIDKADTRFAPEPR